MRANSIDRNAIARVPPRWPLGPPVPVRVKPTMVAGLAVEAGPPGDRAMRGALHAPKKACTHVTAEVLMRNSQGGIVYRSTHRLPIDISIPVESFMIPVESAELTARAQAEIAPHLAVLRHEPVLILHNRPDPENYEPFSCLLAYTVEVSAAGHVVAMHAESAPWQARSWTNWAESGIEWPEGSEAGLLAGDASIRVRGDGGAALDVFMKSAFEGPYREYWSGEFTAPLPTRPHPLPMLR
jgi:hypothetical protein